MVHHEREAVPVEKEQDESVQQWAEAQWEDVDMIIGRVRESILYFDLERYSADFEATSSYSTAYSNLNSISPETDRLNHNELEEISWDGPDDQANPMNWPIKKKAGVITIMAMMTLLT
jgi:hypothetical protein